MTILDTFKQVYSLDTLDTRLTTSSKTPSKDANDLSARTTGKEVRNSELPPGAQSSKWGTPEFYLYTLVLLFCVPSMYKAVWDVSQPTSVHYKEYEDKLSDGWLFGRKVDNSDGQYASFRDNVPYLAILLLVHPLLRSFYDRLVGTDAQQDNIANKGVFEHSAPQRRLRGRLNFDMAFGLFYITALHGVSAIKIMLIVLINYTIARRAPRNAVPALTWGFNIAMMFIVELTKGFRLSSISLYFHPEDIDAAYFWHDIDLKGGLIPRWEVLFNFSLLRMISFNMDHYWSHKAGSPLEVCEHYS